MKDVKDKKAVIFDMDGVLFDTEHLCMDAWVSAAQEFGVEGMEEISFQCIGRNSNDTKNLVLDQLGKDFPYDSFREKVTKQVWEYYEKNGVPVKKGVRELLVYLQESGYLIGLASSSRKEAVMSHLNSTGLTAYFAVIVTGDRVEHSKPLPDIYLLACKEMGVEPGNAYAIEDSPNGIRSAHGAGMLPIMVPDMIPADEEMEKLSYKIFPDLLKVLDFLRSVD